MGEAPERIGPYRVLTRLGEGGMAETFSAEKHGPGGFVQRVCVKRIRQGLDADPDYVRQFLAEARIAATLRHANIAQVIDFGQDGSDYWLALELIDGMDLRALLGSCGGRLPAGLVAQLGMELASALDVAHRAGGNAAGEGGIVHRDVSPSNVLLSLEGEVKLADFGIARRLDEPRHTRTGIIRGKVPYMAPEYAESGRYDHRSDLFALGALLYEALAGQRPHDGPGDFETLRRATLGEHPALGALCPDAPAALCDVIERLLAPNPAQRPGHAGALLDALAPLRAPDGRRELARLVRKHHSQPDPRHDTRELAPAEPTATELAQACPAPALPTRTARRSPAPRTGPPIAIAVVGLPLLVAGAIWMIGHDIRPARHGVPTATAPTKAQAATPADTRHAAAAMAVNDGQPATAADAGTATGTGTAPTGSPAGATAAQLTVIVIPFGTASVDGSPRRDTPLKLELAPGSHMIRAEGRGQSFERSLQLEAGQKKRVVFQ